MEQALNPASLPEGTHVGPWRLGQLLGRGTFGTVYFAEGTGPDARGPSALKLAHAPHDERFAREVELLSRLEHPCIPRLLGHGHWQSPSGARYPYLAMERLEGVPLYEWAQDTCPTSRQLLRLLAGLARALEAVHAAGGVHRDVKGGNVLVRSRDGRGFLVDFGSCHYQGAAPLTWQPYPPGTLAYRAPEAFAYAQQRLDSRGTLPPYAPKPADDLFALGITAWRLVTGDYPPSSMHQEANAGPLEAGPQSAHELNPRCSPQLSLLISRMLSVPPEVRGTAHELAEALEQTERREGPVADVPLFLNEEPQPEQARRLPPPSGARARHRRMGPRFTAVSVSAALAGVAAFWVANMQHPTQRSLVTGEEQDGGTVGLGDSVMTAPEEMPRALSTWSGIGLDLPSKPFQGQTRPDANGRCPYEPLVPINGGCWMPVGEDAKNCPPQAFVYKGRCYAPILNPRSPPTSSPADAPDGGAR